MYKITTAIRKAVGSEAEEVGGFTALARLVGCHPTLPLRIAKDFDKAGISPKIMFALFPHIRKHLDENEIEKIERYLQLREVMADKAAAMGAVFPPAAMEVIESLQSDIDKLLSSRNSMKEPDGLYGEISTEARLIAEKYDSLPRDLRRQILTEILQHITKGQGNETSKRKASNGNQEEGIP